jgi:rhodanese-related sulfurtransferase
MRFHTVRIPRDPACPACGTREITSLIDYDEYCGTSPDSYPTAEAESVDLTPTELAQRLSDRDDIALIDVREPYEWALGRIPGARLIPLGELAAAMSSLDSTREVVVYCRSGVRSANAARQLRAAGFRALNLTGGILRWSDDVDPTVRVLRKPRRLTQRPVARWFSGRASSSVPGEEPRYWPVDLELCRSKKERRAGGKSAICSGVKILESSVIASTIASKAATCPARILCNASRLLYWSGNDERYVVIGFQIVSCFASSRRCTIVIRSICA